MFYGTLQIINQMITNALTCINTFTNKLNYCLFNIVQF